MKKMNIWKRLGLLTLSTCAAITLAMPLTASAAGQAASYADGTYTGTGSGFGGDIKVKVTVKGGKIASIKEVSQSETPEYYNKAKTLYKSIAEKNSTDVDSVSGATRSSAGIKEAVRKALKKAAKADPSKPDASIFASGKGTKSSPFQIKTARQLRAFGKSVAGEVDYTGYYVQLSKNISVSSKEWSPIGGGSTAFNGTFLGKGHTVSGMTIRPTNKSFRSGKASKAGFFSMLGGKAVVKGLKLTKVNLNIKAPGIVDAGTITGTTTGQGDKDHSGSTIRNCSASGKITVKNEEGNIWAGGLVGMQFRGAVINSTSAVNVTASEHILKTSADIGDEEYWVEAGGISGLNFWGLIANSTSTGNVKASYYCDQTKDHSKNTTYAAAGLISGLSLGTETNNYVSGTVTTPYATKYAGVLDGLVEGSAKSTIRTQIMGNRYSTKVRIKNGKKKYAPKKSNLAVIRSGDEKIVTISGNKSYSPKKGKALTSALNKGRKSTKANISSYGIKKSSLTAWTYNKKSKMPVQKCR